MERKGTCERLSILAVNCGSSSLKFGLYLADGGGTESLLEGEAEQIGQEHSTFWVEARGQARETENVELPDYETALTCALNRLARRQLPQVQAVGHRFVHGGPELRKHVVLTPEIEGKLQAAVHFAPLHMPASLSALRAIKQQLPTVPQVVCFDTAFHAAMPAVSRTYALPEPVRKLGVERFGFHGLSLESIVRRLEPVPERLVVAHLGNGASVTAIRDGRSIDTTMGLTPSGGVMMGTRCGDLDPGAMLYLMRQGYQDPARLEQVVDHQSGLLGVSGTSNDTRELIETRAQDERADLALSMFCYQVRKAVASMAAALGGLDLLVFTAGIGEHAAGLREEICKELAFLVGEGRAEVRVIATEEDAQIARNTFGLLSDADGPG